LLSNIVSYFKLFLFSDVSCYKVTGHIVSMDVLSEIGLGGLCDQLLDLVKQIRSLKLDLNEYVCLKFVILLNPGTSISLLCIIPIIIFIVTGSFFVLMCYEAGQSAFLHTQLYLSTNLDHILVSNVSWH